MGKANNDSLDIRGGMRKKWLVHLFPLPAVAIYTIFIVYPILAAFTYSLVEWKGMVMGGFN